MGTKKLGRPTVLSPKIEHDLKEHILMCERMFYGLTPEDVRSLAFEIAQKHGLERRFNTVKKMAGRDWLNRFLERHPEISVQLSV